MDLNEKSLSLLLKAIRFASRKHNNQRRKDKGASPYINHPIAVVDTLWRVGQVRNMSTVISGILHDTLEDTDTTPDELQEEFNSEIRSIVEEVSDDKELAKDDRKRLQVKNARHKSLAARHIKLADKICNIQDIIASPPAGWSEDRKMEYVRWSQDVVNRIRGTNPELETFFDNLCAKWEP
jgi:guanosine-3',5'-bis(diphosphate) 3'-pyrophosphohydrolase